MKIDDYIGEEVEVPVDVEDQDLGQEVQESDREVLTGLEVQVLGAGVHGIDLEVLEIDQEVQETDP